MAPRNPWHAALLLLSVACGEARSGPAVRTILLPDPEDTVSAFEPFVVIDPNAADRIVVGAQYGPGYNRGGMRTWNWSTPDGGKTWSGSRVIPKAFPAGQALAADLTMAVGPDGTVYHLSLTADSAPNSLMTAAAVLAVSSDGGRSYQPRIVFGQVDQSQPGVMVFTDKSWIATDQGITSPGRGNLYFGWSRNRVDFRDTSVSASPAFAVSRDGGRTLDPPIALASKGFGVTIGVRGDGTVDAAWYELRSAGTDGYRLLHASSRDGGRSFGSPSVVTELGDTSQTLDLPQITVGPSNRLLLCWTQGTLATSARQEIWCSTRPADGEWEPARAASGNATGGSTSAYPSIAGSESAFWLLEYIADSTNLSVQVLRSTDGRTFTSFVRLVVQPLPQGGLCARPGLPCRRSGVGFFPGDYVSLAGSPRRLAAAYAMPRPGGSPGQTSMMVSVIDP